jgi:2'-5' RNA ligase
MRIFIALDIDDAIRKRIQAFMDDLRAFAPEARWVRPESLHVTLKFVGGKSTQEIEDIKNALARISAGAMEISFRGYGFFPGSKPPSVLWIGVEAGPGLARLAHSVDECIAGLGLSKEEGEFTPHLTLARRGGAGSRRKRGNDDSGQSFRRLQERLAAMAAPDFGTMTAREFYLYESQPGPGGSRYTKIARFALT